jgi:hypothetical protein
LIPVQRTAWVQAPIRQIDLVGRNSDGAQRTFDNGSGVVAHSLAICIGDVTERHKKTDHDGCPSRPIPRQTTAVVPANRIRA